MISSQLPPSSLPMPPPPPTNVIAGAAWQLLPSFPCGVCQGSSFLLALGSAGGVWGKQTAQGERCTPFRVLQWRFVRVGVRSGREEWWKQAGGAEGKRVHR